MAERERRAERPVDRSLTAKPSGTGKQSSEIGKADKMLQRSWWFWTRLVLGIFAAFVFIPVIWLLLSKALGLAPLTSGEAGGSLIATIGGIMGAIFTIGGLVVALVAILAQLTINDRVESAIASASDALESRYRERTEELEARYRGARQELEKRYEQELRPQLLRQAKDQVQAEIAFFKAGQLVSTDWQAAEQLVTEALQKDAALEGARSFLALNLSNLVLNGFWNRHHPPSPYPFITSSYPVDLPGRYAVPVSSSLSALSAASPTELPVMEALKWLEDARNHDETVGGRVLSDIALMSAVLVRHDKMITAIDGVAAASPEALRFLSQPRQLWILASASGNDRNRLQALGSALGISLPMSTDEIVAAANALDVERAYRNDVDWYVFPVPPAGSGASAPMVPETLKLFVRGAAGPNRTAMARYFGVRTTGPLIPEDIPAHDASGNEQHIPLTELIEKLQRRFLFIAPLG